MKICILTFPPHSNYGALLQTYALQKVLKQNGNEVFVASDQAIVQRNFFGRLSRFGYNLFARYVYGDLRYVPFKYFFRSLDKPTKNQKIVNANTSKFISDNFALTPIFEGGGSPDLSNISKFDALVFGSDQVWRAAYMKVDAYFLNFNVPQHLRCIAYAASFGSDNLSEYTTQDIENCKKGIRNFKAVSVREDSGVKLCKDFFNIDAQHLLDPTLLLDKSDYLELISAEDKQRQDVLLCYILDRTKEKHEIINEVAHRLKLNPFEVMPEQELTLYTKKRDLSKSVFKSVSTWLASYRDAKFVITDSFHGTVFSIIFNKPFLVINNSKRGSARFNSLLKMFEVEHRMITSTDEIDDTVIKDIDYSEINRKHSQMKLKALNFLDVTLM